MPREAQSGARRGDTHSIAGIRAARRTAAGLQALLASAGAGALWPLARWSSQAVPWSPPASLLPWSTGEGTLWLSQLPACE